MSDEAEIPELTLEQAWARLAGDPRSVLLDVRTRAEWDYVGIPDLESLGKQVRLVEWTTYPAGEPNPDFLGQATQGIESDQPVLALCRSGVRSLHAARLLRRAGYANVYNVTAGFEGPLGPDRHRHDGWKGQLPWIQK